MARMEPCAKPYSMLIFEVSKAEGHPEKRLSSKFGSRIRSAEAVTTRPRRASICRAVIARPSWTKRFAGQLPVRQGGDFPPGAAQTLAPVGGAVHLGCRGGVGLEPGLGRAGLAAASGHVGTPCGAPGLGLGHAGAGGIWAGPRGEGPALPSGHPHRVGPLHSGPSPPGSPSAGPGPGFPPGGGIFGARL